MGDYCLFDHVQEHPFGMTVQDQYPARRKNGHISRNCIRQNGRTFIGLLPFCSWPALHKIWISGEGSEKSGMIFISRCGQEVRDTLGLRQGQEIF